MAWTPPTKPLFIAGEIPNKKIISEQELANLEKNKPRSIIDELISVDISVINSIDNKLIDNYTKTIKQRISLLDPTIDDFLEDLDSKIGLFDIVAESNFENILKSELKQANKTFQFKDVLSMVYLKELNSFDFYYGIGNIDNEDVIVITLIKSWEDNHKWDNRNQADYHIPNFLSRKKDNIYVSNNNFTFSEIRKILKFLGFIENHEII